jgi:hypothetical protein
VAGSTVDPMSTTFLPPGSARVGDPFGAALTAVRAEFAGLADTPTWSLAEDQLTQRLGEALAVQAAAGELVSRLAGDVDARDLASKAGASSTRAYLMAAYQMSVSEAARTVATARAMTTRVETTRQGFAAGRVSAEQALVVAEAVNRLSLGVDPVRVEHAQVDLIGHAQTLSYLQLRYLANHLVEVIDPDGADAILAEQLEAEEARALAATTSGAVPVPTGSRRSPGSSRTWPTRC